MCGITGFVNFDNVNNYQNVLKEMANSIEFRGPDNTNFYFDQENQVALGHNRLSIIDLNERSNQPLKSNNGKYIILFNGEIYNFRLLKKKIETEKNFSNWKTESDTEILIEGISLFGLSDFLDLLEGMFAFALYDTIKKKIFLVRDRFGEKPLYYYHNSKDFIFTSDLRSLKYHPNIKLDISKTSTKEMLKYSFIIGNKTIYKNIYKLEPATILEFCLKEKKIIKRLYWNKEKIFENQFDNYNDENEIIKNLDQLLFEKIKNSSYSDRPISCFLSGGIDSSLIASLYASGSVKKIKTFTAIFDTKKKFYNEGAYAKEISNFLGTDHTEVVLNEDDFLKHVEEIPKIYSEPFGDSSAIPTFSICKSIKLNNDVALSGDGGDEIFGGYYRYLRGYNFWNKYKKNNLIKSLLKISKQIQIPKLSLLEFFFTDVESKFDKSISILGNKNLEQYYEILISSDFVEPFLDTNVINEKLLKFKKNIDERENLRLFDLSYYMVDDILVKIDRASMYNSLEVRSPFLNHKIFEYLSTIPRNIFYRDISGKYLAKKILRNYIPSKLTNRAKHGFEVPIKEWLLGKNKKYFEGILFDESNYVFSIIEREKIIKLWTKYEKNSNLSKFFWNLISFNLWHKINVKG